MEKEEVRFKRTLISKLIIAHKNVLYKNQVSPGYINKLLLCACKLGLVKGLVKV